MLHTVETRLTEMVENCLYPDNRICVNFNEDLEKKSMNIFKLFYNRTLINKLTQKNKNEHKF